MPFILTMTTRRCDDTLGNRPLLPRFAEEEVGRRSEKGEARRPAAAVAHQGRATPEEGQAYSPFIYTLFLRSQARTPCGLSQRLAAREPQVLAFPEIRGYAWRGLTRKRHLRRRAAQGFPLEGKTAGNLCAAA